MAALGVQVQVQTEQAENVGREFPRASEGQATSNFTDLQPRVMLGPNGGDILQGYNCQAAVDHKQRVIVPARATNQESDKQEGVFMIGEASYNMSAVPKESSADAGYYSAQIIDDLYSLECNRSSRRTKPDTAPN